MQTYGIESAFAAPPTRFRAAICESWARTEVLGAVAEAEGVLAKARAGTVPATTADALRNAIKNAPPGADTLVADMKGVLSPADNYGGRMSFRYVAPFSIVIIFVFGVLYLRDRAAGGYEAEKLAPA